MNPNTLSHDDEEYINSFPNDWRDFVSDAPQTIPHIYSSEGSVRWGIQTNRKPYIQSGALRKVGKQWKYNPKKYVRTWLSNSVTGISS